MCFCCQRSTLLAGLTAPLSSVAASRREFLTCAALSTIAAHACGNRAWAAPSIADVVLRNGIVRTMVRGKPTSEAVAVGAGRILAVGSASEISALAGPTTRMVDLQGRTVLPGLIDPHHHAVLAAVVSSVLLNIGISHRRSRADALAALKEAAARTAPGEWIAAGFYDNLLQGGDLTGDALDDVSAAHPIFVMYVNGHVGAANALAFARVGIRKDVGTIGGVGRFGRRADGMLDGLIYEQPALLEFTNVAVPTPTPQGITAALTAYAALASAAGHTTLHEPGTVKPEWVDHLAQISNDLDVRLSASFSTDAIEAGRRIAAMGPPNRARRIADSRFSLYGMKFWADGSNQAQTAAQTAAYLGRADRGRVNYAPDEMTRLCRSARDAGWSILVHCQGDAAVDDAIDAIEKAYGAHPTTGINRIEHATMARQDQIERMKALGIEPSFMPDFIHLYGAAYRDQIFGNTRADFMVPAGAAARLGLPFTLHSDAPAAGLPINPLRLVQAAVTRRCVSDGSVVGRGEALAIDAALRAITVDAARQIGLADDIGTLEAGKEADLTILESDPCTVDPDRLAAIRVSETWVAGVKKFG